MGLPWPSALRGMRGSATGSGLALEFGLINSWAPRQARKGPLLRARDRQHIAQKDRPFRGNQLAGTHAVENLPIIVPLQPDLHGAAGEASAVRRHPYGHGSVPFTHD